ncbi:MAG: tRNA cyclic N6-threonylcarbamoyladenosine(37) synthase TcdA [Epulopiscium sp. Nuni2H_MBin003]|nr:MAG: tRNA cyclic N6-threonylcarbamoyladenosine(37) synthase TcdA [Epulopiscium sp. Nuni2H_MBin003]
MHAFTRTEMLLGTDTLQILSTKKVAIFGIGGVGSYTAEALVRTGVGNIVLIDSDDICISNINRQIHATHLTVGQPKVNVMRDRLLSINPNLNIVIHKQLYTATNALQLLSTDYDYVVDAIDMVSSKIDLIERCTLANINIISAMGAANKLDPTKFVITDIYKTSMCPLAKVMRHELKKRGVKKLKVVYSTEQPIKSNHFTDDTRRPTPASVAFVPSVCGLIIASAVIKDLMQT